MTGKKEPSENVREEKQRRIGLEAKAAKGVQKSDMPLRSQAGCQKETVEPGWQQRKPMLHDLEGDVGQISGIRE